jgi:hypothetical protein
MGLSLIFRRSEDRVRAHKKNRSTSRKSQRAVILVCFGFLGGCVAALGVSLAFVPRTFPSSSSTAPTHGVPAVFVPSMLGQTAAQSDAPPEVITESVASKMIAQLAEGLQGHSEKTMLGVFDLRRMEGGPQFKEQVTAFFNQYDRIRVHFKLTELAEKNVVVVDAEMDETPPDEANPPQHKTMELRFTGANGPAGWKFIDVRPRNFFS